MVGRQSTASRSSVVPEFNLIAPLASTIVQTTEYLLLAPFHIQPTTTMRSLFVLALLVAAASAFVAPANKAVGKIFFSGEDLQLISLGIFDVERCWREQYYCQFGLLIDSLLA